MSDPVFDPNADYATIREFGKSVRYQQGGYLFDRNGVCHGPYQNYQQPGQEEPAPQPAVQQAGQSRRDEVLQRAQSKLQDFSARPDPDGIQAENTAAQHAERLAE